MRINVAQAADHEPVLQLLSQVWTDDYVVDCWDDWVNQPEQGVPLVARTADGGVAGIAYVRLLSQRVAWLQALRVHPDARRQGVGRALTTASLEHARKLGCRVARLLIDADNQASLSMTAQTGFQPILRLHKLMKTALRTDGPAVEKPAMETAPALLQLARQQGIAYWHSNWETHDLSLFTLQQATERGSLRILHSRPTAVVADINAHDDEYDVYLPVGERQDALALLHGLESEAAALGKERVELLLPEGSSLLSDLIALAGYELMEDDGLVLWEYPLD